jgi:hypothetical protein
MAAASRVRSKPQPKGFRVMRYSLPPWAFRLARLAEAGKIVVD